MMQNEHNFDLNDNAENAPDGDDVREQNHETEEVTKPRTQKSLQNDHNDRQNNLSQEQSFRQAV